MTCPKQSGECWFPACDCPPPEFDPGPVPMNDGASLLDDVHVFLCRYVAFPSEAAGVAVTLWAAHAHAAGAAESTPRLALLSPEPGSGKTRTLEVLELLTPLPMFVLSASPAAIFRTIEEARPTLLFDECDAIFTRHGKDDTNEDLRALLNAGHRKGAAIPRCVGPLHNVRRFPVYCPVALAGLGDLPATLMSRSVVIRMRRRAPGEHVEPFRHREAMPPAADLRDRLEAWTAEIDGELAQAWPEMPDGVTDRPADVWESLLAIGDAAGGDWPKRARAACAELAGAAETGEASLGVKLLADLAEVFGSADGLPTQVILSRLHELEESPWASFGKPPKPLDARGLAHRLRAYGVASANVRAGDAVRKGYRAEDLYDPWTRYLPDTRTAATSATPLQPQADDPFPVADDEPVADTSATSPPSATDSAPLTSDVAHVAHVADLREPEAAARRPLLLDLFCGAGGCSAGYHRAGFDIIGADAAPITRYPFEFHQMDWRAALEQYGPAADVLAASPPCQDYSASRHLGDGSHPRLIAEVRAAFEATGKPWVIENVEGSGLPDAPTLDGAAGVLLCGAMFGLRTYRHRLFEASFPLTAPSHPHHAAPQAKMGRPVKPGEFISVVGHFSDIAAAKEAMGIDWMTGPELAQAIPPAYTEWIGRQLAATVTRSGLP